MFGPTQLYSVKSPEELEKFVPLLVSRRIISELILPAIFRSSDRKMLLVGNEEMGKLKLPDTTVHAQSLCPVDTVEDRVQELARFAFKKASGPIVPRYTGLIRHKKVQNVAIVPVCVLLNDASNSPFLSTNQEWLDHSPNNADHVWKDRSEMQELLHSPDKDMLTANSAFIIQCALDSLFAE